MATNALAKTLEAIEGAFNAGLLDRGPDEIAYLLREYADCVESSAELDRITAAPEWGALISSIARGVAADAS